LNKDIRVVVTGIGALTPIGNNIHQYWEGLKNGVSGADNITRFDASKFRTKFAAEVKGFNPEDFIEKKEVKKMDIYSQFAIACVDEAVKDAHLESDKLNLDRVGVIWGSGIGGLKTFLEEVMYFAKGDGTPKFNPYFIPKMIVNMAPGLIAMRYGYRGVNYATVSACATSGHAIGEAYNNIRLNRADIIVTGGSEAVVNEAAVGGFTSMRAMSERNDSPKTASRPYDNTRDGFVLGEGAGAMILENYDHAVARGAKIYGEIIGYGVSCDAYHMTAPHPEGIGVMSCMNMAFAEAKIDPSQIGYINTHGTSTPLGDGAELIAIKKVFGEENSHKVNISSTKSMTGHLLGAAGAIEGIACILAMKHGIIPPTINHIEDDPTIDPLLNLTFNVAQERQFDYALCNTFGFGGHNVSLIIKKFDQA